MSTRATAENSTRQRTCFAGTLREPGERCCRGGCGRTERKVSGRNGVLRSKRSQRDWRVDIKRSAPARPHRGWHPPDVAGWLRGAPRCLAHVRSTLCHFALAPLATLSKEQRELRHVPARPVMSRRVPSCPVMSRHDSWLRARFVSTHIIIEPIEPIEPFAPSRHTK
jgi:hypothetical protein